MTVRSWRLAGIAALVAGVALVPAQAGAMSQANRFDATKCLQTEPGQTQVAGWPCEPFEHRAQVVAFMRSLLLEEGFRPRLLATGSARQIQFRALREGVVHEFTVVPFGRAPHHCAASRRPTGA